MCSKICILGCIYPVSIHPYVVLIISVSNYRTLKPQFASFAAAYMLLWLCVRRTRVSPGMVLASTHTATALSTKGSGSKDGDTARAVSSGGIRAVILDHCHHRVLSWSDISVIREKRVQWNTFCHFKMSVWSLRVSVRHSPARVARRTRASSWTTVVMALGSWKGQTRAGRCSRLGSREQWSLGCNNMLCCRVCFFLSA